ncbi:hypothetical protein JIG36_24290 [Actinoplanes sp. LDG1-06]|uniref:ApeA N-terminal domain-containing protein n=1 Tax=Paractinoplanes ovalisporus TaxID=2810368 RepID=A0ABS2AFU3_9ACTN|nr:hypothetical protein [Actinoplanes ovalisporus]MBM2618682.1 hypothetical protein [Actinoplanes ovalisporus]
MRKSALEPGDKRTGIFIYADGVAHQCVVGSIWIDRKLGVLAEIPYIEFGTEQFVVPASWFNNDIAPSSLLFRSEDLYVSLYDCRVIRSVKGTHLDIGRLRAREAVFAERTGQADSRLLVTKMVSRIDGLAAWSNLSSIDWSTELVDRAGPRKMRVDYTVQSNRGFEWEQGPARMSIATHWTQSDATGRGIHLADDAILESRFPKPSPVDRHLAEHRKFRDLLSILAGPGVRFVEHFVRDQGFGIRMLDGKIRGAAYERIICAGTISENSQDAVPTSDWPIVASKNLDASDLEWWSKEYDSSRRSILPVASILQRPHTFAEDKVINCSMSVEALGIALGSAFGEEPTLTSVSARPTTSTYFYRVIDALDIDVSAVAESRIEFARAMASNYNTIKHPDRGDFPDALHSIYAGKISLALARMAILQRLPSAGGTVAKYAKGWQVSRIFDGMKADGVEVVAGKFVSVA